MHYTIYFKSLNISLSLVYSPQRFILQLHFSVRLLVCILFSVSHMSTYFFKDALTS